MFPISYGGEKKKKNEFHINWDSVATSGNNLLSNIFFVESPHQLTLFNTKMLLSLP